MAKKTSKKSAKRSKTKAAEEETSRESFLPKADPEPDPVRVETAPLKAILPPAKRSESLGNVRFEITKLEDRRVRLELEIPPVPPRSEEKFLPANATAEQLVAVIAGTIAELANGLVADGVYWHDTREREERESRQRYENVH